jgi:hypothetical protein
MAHRFTNGIAAALPPPGIRSMGCQGNKETLLSLVAQAEKMPGRLDRPAPLMAP